MDEGIPQNTQPQSLAFKGLCTYWFKTLQNKPMRSVKVRITIFFFNLMHGHDIPTLLEMFQGFPTAPRIESKSLILSPWSLWGPICLRLEGPLAPLHFAFFLPGNMTPCSRLEPLHLFLLIRNSSHHHDHMPWGLCFLAVSLFLRLKYYLFVDHHVSSSPHKHLPFLNALAVYWNYHIKLPIYYLSLALECKFLEVNIQFTATHSKS